MNSYYPVLTIAGSDPSGGAGIQADIKSISAQGCYAMSAITAITAQNTLGVEAVEGVSPGMVGAQIAAVCADIPPLAVKTGMLFSASIIEVVAEAVRQMELPNLVVDPVMASSSGTMLLESDAVAALTSELMPLAILVTPNAAEARAITGYDNPQMQARALKEMGCRNILLKGGDSNDTPGVKIDYLVMEDSDKLLPMSADAIETRNTHGTGCSLSAAIAARLALGDDLRTAVGRAKAYVTRALAAGADVEIGNGHGPLNHFFDPKRQKIRREWDQPYQ